MAQHGYDTLFALTDSRYRLTMIVARRAAQLKSGFPSLLTPEEMPPAPSNTVTVAMTELILGKPLRFGSDLPSEATLQEARGRSRRDREELGDAL